MRSIRFIGDLVDDLFFFAFEWFLMLCLFALACLAAATVAFTIGALVTTSWPWNWWDSPSVNRQVTNVTYDHAGGMKGNMFVLNVQKIASVNSVTAPCTYKGRDLFDPTSTSRDDVQSGWRITFRAGGLRHTIDVPDGKFHRVLVAGNDTPSATFTFNKIVLYYDRNWDSLWADSPAIGPKDTVVSCMTGLSLSDRMRLGLKGATVFVPEGSALATTVG